MRKTTWSIRALAHLWLTGKTERAEPRASSGHREAFLFADVSEGIKRNPTEYILEKTVISMVCEQFEAFIHEVHELRV